MSEEQPTKNSILSSISENFENKRYRETLYDIQWIQHILQKYNLEVPKSLKSNIYTATVNSDTNGDFKTLTNMILSLIPDHFGAQNPTNYDEDLSFPSLENPSMISGNCTIYYNLSLINYCNKNYFSASKLLELLFKQIDQMPDYLAIKTCYLLLDSYLALSKQQCNVLQKASNVISHLEKAFPSLLKKNNDNKKSNINSNVTTNSDENSFSFPPIDSNQFKYLLHLYKAKVHLYNKAVNQSKREIKCCMSGGGNQNPTSIFIKSNLEYLRQNYSKSIKLLNALQTHHSNLDSQIQNSLKANLSALYYNNMGCIHFQLKKYQSAAYYFARSLKQNELLYHQPSLAPSPSHNNSNFPENSEKFRIVTLRNYTRDRKIEIFYNNGLLLLLTGKAELAFECFQAAALTYYKNPRLWLRLAECCVAHHSQSIDDIKKSVKLTRSPIDFNAVSRLIINSNLYSISNIETSPSSSPANILLAEKPFGVISLEYAEVCLRSCLFLCRKLINSISSSSSSSPSPSSSSSVANNNANSNNNSNNNNANINNNAHHILKDEIDTIRQAALANLAYVSLATNNPMITLSCTKNLLPSKPGNNHTYSVFAHMYAAEAYCMLGLPSEALRHLSSSIQSEELLTNLNSPYNTPATVRYSLLHNLTVSHILNDDMNQAQQILAKALAQCPNNCAPFAIILQVYIELRNGNTMNAVELLKYGRTSLPLLPIPSVTPLPSPAVNK